MPFQRVLPQSLKSRVTLLTTLIVVVGFLGLAAFIKDALREELMVYTGTQQRSALKLLSAEVNRVLQDQLATLSGIASELEEAPPKDTASLNKFLRSRSYLEQQFNAGVSIWNAKGVRVASNSIYWDNAISAQDVSQFLQSAAPGISRVRRLKEFNTATLSIYVPVRRRDGTLVGAVAGSIRLDQPNFLTSLASNRYSKTGNFFLVDATQRIIIATSDESRLFEVLPDRGVIPWIDRFVDGFDGTARVVNPHGVEVLVSVAQIPLAHWYASVTLAPHETFELIDNIKPRGRAAALAMLAISLLFIWFMLRMQLAPMTAAAKMLEGFVRKKQAPQALPVVRPDEVGQLVSGFNQLLESLVQQKKVAKDSEDFKQAVLNSVASAIAVLDHDGNILSINDAWAQFSNEFLASMRSTEAALGANFLSALVGLRADATHQQAMTAEEGVRAVLEGRMSRFSWEYPVASAQQQYWRSISVTPFKGAVLEGAVVSIEDITERVEMQKQVHELAWYDSLTKLPNRRLAMERLTQHLARARRGQSILALLFIDLDRFKPINDELGHEVGDWLLHAVAQRIQACIRESDTAARMGGDEFIVLLPDLQSMEAALAVGEKIRDALARDFVTPGGRTLQISSSIGIALYPDHGDAEDQLLRLGDEAMYAAKRGGRNAVHVWGAQG